MISIFCDLLEKEELSIDGKFLQAGYLQKYGILW